MKYKQKAVIYFLMFLLLISSVLAFDISSTSSISLCPSTTELVTTKVSGSGTYTVNVAGSAAPWTTTVPTGFSTTNQEIIYTYITPPSNTLPGAYTVEITINNGASTKKSSLQVNVLDCFQSNIKEVSQQTTCPGQNAKFDFIIQNTGQFQETYTLSTTGSASSWVVLSQDRVELDKSQEKTIFAYITVPQEARGTHEFTLTSKGTAGTVSSSTAQINVQGCFDYTAAVDKELHNLCDHSTLIAPITITNTGTTKNTYSFELDGPSWTMLEKTSLTLDSNQFGAIALIASPDYDVTGDFDISITIVDEEGKQGFIQPLKINVNDCHDLSVSIEKEEANICAALIKTFNVDITNSGEVKDSFKVSLSGPTWASLDKDSLELETGEKQSLTLTLSPSINEKGTHNADILVESTDKGYSEQDSLKLNVLTQQQCYNPNLKLEENFVSIPQESQITVPLTIENNGTQLSTFILGLSGTASSFVQLNPSTITLDPNTAQTIYLYLAPTKNIGLGNYKAKITIKLEDTNILDTETLNMEVVESQLGLPQIPEEPKEDFWQNVLNFLFGIPEVSPEEDEFIQDILQEDIEDTEEVDEVIDEEVNETTEEITTEDAEETEEIDENLTIVGDTAEISLEVEEGTQEEESVLDKLLGKEEKITGTAIAPLATSDIVNNVLDYRNYILTAIIILLLLILVVKYRKELLDFFTEEEEDFDDEEKPKKRVNKKKPKKIKKKRK